MGKMKNRIGETRTMNNGLKATIIAYRGCMDMNIQFEDGVVREHTTYDTFKKGKIAYNPISPSKTKIAYAENRIGETRVMNNGMKATISAYRNSGSMDVQFEDGSIRENIPYARFKRGKVACSPSNQTETRTAYTKKRIGETRTMHNGMEATIIAYRKSYDMDVQFEDGTVREHVAYHTFKNGHISNKALYRPSEKEAKVTLVSTNEPETVPEIAKVVPEIAEKSKSMTAASKERKPKTTNTHSMYNAAYRKKVTVAKRKKHAMSVTEEACRKFFGILSDISSAICIPHVRMNRNY